MTRWLLVPFAFAVACSSSNDSPPATAPVDAGASDAAEEDIVPVIDPGDPGPNLDGGVPVHTLGPSNYPDGTRRVWVQATTQAPFYEPDTTLYGADYPLVLQPTSTSARRLTDDATRFVNSGISGVQLLLADGATDVADQSNSLFTIFDSAGVELAPCIYPQGDLTASTKVLTDYAAAAASHPSAAQISINGVNKWIVFTYGTREHLTPDDVTSLRTAAENAGVPVYIVGDVESAIARNGGSFDANRVESFAKASVAAYLPAFDVAWTFDEGVDQAWDPLVSALTAGGHFFAGGMLPSYDDESVETGDYVDAEGTAKYRRQWTDAVASGIGWNTIASWNDVAGHDQVGPTSSWSWTRADITAFYSAPFRGIDPPSYLAQPQLYVTTPERINVNQAGRTVEALLLNSGTTAATVTVELRDGANALVGTAVSADVAAGAATAAVVSFAPTTMPAGHFVRAVATSKLADGTPLQSVTSAPILVYADGEQATGFTFSRTKYRSIPARLALPGTVAINVPGNPASAATTATVVAPTGTEVRFADVLQNGFLVAKPFTAAGTAIPIPLTNGSKILDQTTVDTPASGFYMARVIDESENVGYSDPVYVTPP